MQKLSGITSCMIWSFHPLNQSDKRRNFHMRPSIKWPMYLYGTVEKHCKRYLKIASGVVTPLAVSPHSVMAIWPHVSRDFWYKWCCHQNFSATLLNLLGEQTS